MATQKEINKFLKDLPIARHLWSIDEINNALEKINIFVSENNLLWDDYTPKLQSRYKTLCNKRRKIWNDCTQSKKK